MPNVESRCNQPKLGHRHSRIAHCDLLAREMPSIQHIAKRLSRISRRPAALEVFGATSEIGSGHYFRRNVLKPVDVSALEARLGVRLPLEYVELLTTIGYGIGPYYGLYSPGSITSEMADLSDEGEPTNPAKDFPIVQQDLNELLAVSRSVRN